MGCVQAKADTPVRSLKPNKGYVKGGSKGRVIVVKNGGSSGGDKRVPLEGEKVKNGGVNPRKSFKKKIADDELIGGWPKWLVDNISREVLANLVPKSADSYDKLAKVLQS